MPMAFVFMTVNLGSKMDVLRELMLVDGVIEAYALDGAYDVVARVWAKSQDELGWIIEEQISRIRNVRSVITLLATEDLWEEAKLMAKRRSTAVNICPNCHAEMPLEAKYCGFCGKKLK